MPRIIRNALYLKLKELPELAEFQRDFEKVSGLRLVLVDDLGLGEGDFREIAPICRILQESPEGRGMCARLRQELLTRAVEQPACAVCDAGLQEVAVPVRVSGIPAGYFIFGGTLPRTLEGMDIRRVLHLLRHHGIEFEEGALSYLLTGSAVAVPDTMSAWKRIVQMAARQLALKLTDQLVEAETVLPPAVVKACRHIRARVLLEELSLSSVARQCGVSEGHLSRQFHHATGLTFREYLNQVRLEHARGLILHGNRTITEIAFDSGFHSLSQFHRAFRKVYACSPGQMRAGRHAEFSHEGEAGED